MKIGLMGTHGIGKTSLAYSLLGKLKEHGFNAGLVSENVRDCPIAAGTAKENSVDAQMWILGTQIAREIELNHKFDVVVCDRTVLDNYAYLLWAARRDGTDKRFLESIDNLVTYWSSTYNYLFRLEMNSSTLIPDGFREMDVAWQREMDSRISEIIGIKKVSCFEIPLAPNKRRVERVLEIMKIATPAD